MSSNTVKTDHFILTKNFISDIIRKNKIQTIPTDQISEDHNLFHDLGFDSLDSTELMMDIERATEKPIPDKVMDSVQTVRDVINIIQERYE